MIQIKHISLIASLSLVAYASSPDAGTITKDIEKKLEIKQQQPLPTPKLQTQQETEKKTTPSAIKIQVNGFKISGNSVIATQKLQAVLAPFVGKSLSFSELQDASRTIPEYYRDNGFSSRAFLPPQEVQGGIVEIMILEGKLSAIEIDTATSTRLQPQIAKDIIENAHPMGDILEVKKLEKGLLILGDTPGIRPASSLVAGENAGDSKLKVKLEDTSLFNGNVGYSNSGSKSTGDEQFTASLGVNSPSSVGDQLTFQGMKTRGIDFIKVGYSVPFGTSGLRFGLNTSKMTYEVVEGSEADGKSTSTGFNFNYPAIRSSNANVTFILSYDHKRYLNRSAGTVISDKENNIWNATLLGASYDTTGQNSYGLTLTNGKLDLTALDSDYQADQSTAKTDGEFAKAVLNLGRTQFIADDSSFSLQGMMQQSNKNLDSGEKIYLGGASGVRAYPSSEAGGDEGWMINAELTKNLQNGFALGFFYDIGEVKQHHTLYTGWQGGSTAGNSYRLKGLGTSLSYASGTLSMKATAAFRDGQNPNPNVTDGTDNDGTKKNPRIWFNITKVF